MKNIAIITSSKIKTETIHARHDVIIAVETGLKYFKANPDRDTKNEEYLIGDFDTIKKGVLKSIEKQGVEVIELNGGRNLSDTESAIKFALQKYGRNSEITVYAQNGGRLDHQYTFFNMLRKYPNLALVDDQNYVLSYAPGEYFLSRLAIYKYISFFAFDDAHNFELSGFEYDIEGIDLIEESNTCLSNAFIGSVGKMSFEEGRVMVLYSKDKK